MSAKNKHPEEDNGFEFSSDEIHTNLSWQLEKYHHFQNASRGIISVTITITALIASVYFSFIHPLPKISDSSRSTIGTATSELIIPLDYIGALLIVLIMIFLSMGFFLYSLYSASVGMKRLLGIILDDNDIVGLNSSLSNRVLFRRSNGRFRHEKYIRRIDQNEEKIDEVNDEYITSILRILIGLILIFNSYQLYTFAYDYNFNMIGVFAILFILPSPITRKFAKFVSGLPRNESRDIESSERIWDYLTENWIDRSFLRFIGLASAFTWIVWILSALFI